MTTTFGDLLILRWSRLEIPWKILKVFQSWCFLHPFLILPMFLVRSLASGRIPFPPICIKIKRKTWWVGILESKCERNRGFAWSLLIPFAHPPFWFPWNASQRYVAPLSTPCDLLRQRVANLQQINLKYDLSVYPIRNFIPHPHQTSPITSRNIASASKRVEIWLGKVQTTK